MIMGYRHYLYAVPKKQVVEIQACKTNDDWCNFAENYGYEVSRDYCDDGSGWLSPYKIGTELYELGKYSEIGCKLESERPSLFTSEELKNRYEDYGLALLMKDDFKAVIEAYRQKIIDWLQSLLNPEDNPTIPSKLSKEERKHLAIEHIIEDKIELVRLYKIFDWENNDLVLVGW